MESFENYIILFEFCLICVKSNIEYRISLLDGHIGRTISEADPWSGRN